MAIIRCNALLLLSTLPSLKAVRSSGKSSSIKHFWKSLVRKGPKAQHVRETVDFGNLVPLERESSPSAESGFEITHVEDKEEGSLCKLRWKFSDFSLFPSGGDERLSLWIHLNTKQKAFTYIKANSQFGTYLRDLTIKDNKDELMVSASEHGREVSGLVDPEVKVGRKKRRQAEKTLSEGGPFSPFAHLKGHALDRLIEDIDWEADGAEDTCKRIYYFLAFNAPEGYTNKNLVWLYDFVNKNALKIENKIKGLQKELSRD
ncbi:hypothetical protein FOZ62_023356 [Perkinsus olseni]|uniref:Uncharacterized protein n=1 Tax=Perkinsus olseni TaxID=32597 RepID=A0A7J6QQZ2_PEROL|nr:hypothetical protein FOZ62_023356 [Perkinsus olseni]